MNAREKNLKRYRNLGGESEINTITLFSYFCEYANISNLPEKQKVYDQPEATGFCRDGILRSPRFGRQNGVGNGTYRPIYYVSQYLCSNKGMYDLVIRRITCISCSNMISLRLNSLKLNLHLPHNPSPDHINKSGAGVPSPSISRANRRGVTLWQKAALHCVSLPTGSSCLELQLMAGLELSTTAHYDTCYSGHCHHISQTRFSTATKNEAA